MDLPSAEQWGKLRSDSANFHWTVYPAGEPRTFAGRDELVEAIKRGDVSGGDSCVRHPFGKFVPLREACDDHMFLRKLYDPVAAYSNRAGWIGAFALGGLYLVGTVVLGVIHGGGDWIAPAVLGFLAVLLTPTVVGVFIVYVVARFMDVPLLGAYLGALLALVITVGLGAVGFFVTRAVSRKLVGSLKAEVEWDPLPAPKEE